MTHIRFLNFKINSSHHIPQPTEIKKPKIRTTQTTNSQKINQKFSATGKDPQKNLQDRTSAISSKKKFHRIKSLFSRHTKSKHTEQGINKKNLSTKEKLNLNSAIEKLQDNKLSKILDSLHPETKSKDTEQNINEKDPSATVNVNPTIALKELKDKTLPSILSSLNKTDAFCDNDKIKASIKKIENITKQDALNPNTLQEATNQLKHIAISLATSYGSNGQYTDTNLENLKTIADTIDAMEQNNPNRNTENNQAKSDNSIFPGIVTQNINSLLINKDKNKDKKIKQYIEISMRFVNQSSSDAKKETIEKIKKHIINNINSQINNETNKFLNSILEDINSHS